MEKNNIFLVVSQFSVSMWQ